MRLLLSKSSWVCGAMFTISLIFGVATNAYSRGGFGGGGAHFGGGGAHFGGGGARLGGGGARWGGGTAGHWGVNRWRGGYYGGGRYWGGYPGYGAAAFGTGIFTGAVLNSTYNNGPSCYWTRGRDTYGVLRNFRVCN